MLNLMNSVSRPVDSRASLRALSVLLFFKGEPYTPITFMFFFNNSDEADLDSGSSFTQKIKDSNKINNNGHILNYRGSARKIKIYKKVH